MTKIYRENWFITRLSCTRLRLSSRHFGFLFLFFVSSQSCVRACLRNVIRNRVASNKHNKNHLTYFSSFSFSTCLWMCVLAFMWNNIWMYCWCAFTTNNWIGWKSSRLFILTCFVYMTPQYIQTMIRRTL